MPLADLRLREEACLGWAVESARGGAWRRWDFRAVVGGVDVVVMAGVLFFFAVLCFLRVCVLVVAYIAYVWLEGGDVDVWTGTRIPTDESCFSAYRPR